MSNKRFSAVLLGVLMLLLTATIYAGNNKGKEKEGPLSLTGAIADSQCAFNVHSSSRSHEWMIKKNVPGATDDKSCTMHCVKDMGGNFVLVVKDDVYRLDDQGLAEKFAGTKVKVVGTLMDEKTRTLHILTMESAQ